MNSTYTSSEPNPPQRYQIRIKGHLEAKWSHWFDGFTVELQESGDTLLTGEVVDQAALHGLLKRIRNLGLTLIAITSIDNDE